MVVETAAGADGLDLAVALEVIDGALAWARAQGIPPLSVVVLDRSGHLVAAQRQDGASMFRFDVALGKAWGAVAMGCSSRELAARATDNPNFFGALATTGRGRFLPQSGAVLLTAPDGSVRGAVGASGGTGDQDEACSAAGASRAGLCLDE